MESERNSSGMGPKIDLCAKKGSGYAETLHSTLMRKIFESKLRFSEKWFCQNPTSKMFCALDDLDLIESLL